MRRPDDAPSAEDRFADMDTAALDIVAGDGPDPDLVVDLYWLTRRADMLPYLGPFLATEDGRRLLGVKIADVVDSELSELSHLNGQQRQTPAPGSSVAIWPTEILERFDPIADPLTAHVPPVPEPQPEPVR